MRKFLDLDWDATVRTPGPASRPMSADGLPLHGPAEAMDNVVVAAGHGMFGLTLRATAAVVADLELIMTAELHRHQRLRPGPRVRVARTAALTRLLSVPTSSPHTSLST